MPTFKELQFRQGLNLILADKSPGATERQTRKCTLPIHLTDATEEGGLFGVRF